ncbi:MAG TPA: aminopeptidase [Saprospiraceae bacterium]|nr:aminopeptidase [Saprospiraceae bacterium]
MNWIEKYARLLVDYSLYLKENEKVFVRSSTLAEPLLKAFYKAALEKGAIVETEIAFEDQENILLEYGTENQLKYLSESYKYAIRNFDAYLVIRAPFEIGTKPNIDEANRKLRMEATAPFDQLYFERLGNKSLKRSLCQYPTSYSAKLAGMTLEEYTSFIQSACFLDRENPESAWLELSAQQQKITDYLNDCQMIIYRHPGFEISFSVKDRTWINSDGKANMPSGEIFTSPVEDSVQGEIFFDYPSLMMGEEVQGVRLEVRDGEITNWTANKGQQVLDRVFQIPGTRRFGEAAVATNKNIQRATKNILFDEKIGGTVHMAIGQSYLQCGGKNQSSIHWDLITDMKNGGEIWADGKRIYQDGQFLI